jgi:hypothetical protein
MGKTCTPPESSALTMPTCFNIQRPTGKEVTAFRFRAHTGLGTHLTPVGDKLLEVLIGGQIVEASV